MIDLEKITQDFDSADVRSALYYVSRYVKQASSFKIYSKNIFDDPQGSEPSEAVIDLSNNIIYELSNKYGDLEEISREKTLFILDQISEFETELTSEASEDELRRAEEFVRSLENPPISS